MNEPAKPINAWGSETAFSNEPRYAPKTACRLGSLRIATSSPSGRVAPAGAVWAGARFASGHLRRGHRGVWKWKSLRFLAIGPGFLQGPDGVWRMTRHARRRRDQKGLPPALHKPLVSHPYNPGVTPYQTPRTLPARAACPKCGLSQVLNPVTLDVGIAPEHILMVPGLTYLAMFVEPDEPLDIGVPGP